ncbi:MAG TPA: AI-2E family transporter [Vicinamibacterales bacterium]|nr:AI-2E family transporter [Vicinamibacterales bacterium]
MISDRDYTRRMLQTVAAIAGAIVLLATLWVAREALLLIYISALTAMGFSPLVRLIERPRPDDGVRRVPRWLAILVVYGAIVTIMGLVALAVVPPLVAQAESLWQRLPGEFNRMQSFLIDHGLMSGSSRVTLEQAVQNAPTGAATNAVGTVLIALGSLIGGIFGLVTVVILSFYLLVEAEPMFEYFARFVPAGRRADVATASLAAVVRVSAWLRAQLVLAGVMGTFAAVGLWMMSVPYFYVIALVAAVGETIPIIGPVIGGVTAVVVALTVSPKLALTVGVYFLVLHQLEANILVPKIMERRVGVSPVAVMTALLIGGSLWGLVGAILAIPTAAILSVIIEEIAADQDVRLQRVK